MTPTLELVCCPNVNLVAHSHLCHVCLDYCCEHGCYVDELSLHTPALGHVFHQDFLMKYLV